jgi:hypothetical protein
MSGLRLQNSLLSLIDETGFRDTAVCPEASTLKVKVNSVSRNSLSTPRHYRTMPVVPKSAFNRGGTLSDCGAAMLL